MSHVNILISSVCEDGVVLTCLALPQSLTSYAVSKKCVELYIALRYNLQ